MFQFEVKTHEITDSEIKTIIEASCFDAILDIELKAEKIDGSTVIGVDFGFEDADESDVIYENVEMDSLSKPEVIKSQCEDKIIVRYTGYDLLIDGSDGITTKLTYSGEARHNNPLDVLVLDKSELVGTGVKLAA